MWCDLGCCCRIVVVIKATVETRLIIFVLVIGWSLECLEFDPLRRAAGNVNAKY